MQPLKKSEIILQSKWFYFFLSIIIFLDVIIFTKCIKYESAYEDGTQIFEAVVKSYQIKADKIVLDLKVGEKIRATYYTTDDKNIDINIGDKVEIKGDLSTPLDNTIPNTFNYKKYLYQNRIYKTMSIKEMKVLSKSQNIFARLKNYVYKKASTNEYLLLFICGDKSGLDSASYSSYKSIGIAHLLAISGMHVSVFIMILNKILFWLSENKRKIFIIIFLLFYSYIVGFSPSIMRVVIFYILGYLLSRMNIKLSNLARLLLTAFIILLVNPFNVYSASFQYSFMASLAIILTSKYQKKSYILNILIISFWTLLFSLPITVSMNYEINLMSFLSNLIFIPYVSFFLYPLALICFIFPFMQNIFTIFTNLMEAISNYFSKVNLLVINIPKLNICIIILFYLLLILYVYYHKKRYFFLLLGLLIVNKVIPKLDKNDYVIFFDVGQGDSSAFISSHQKEVILIDTGGVANYQVSDGVILYLKSRGITRIDTLILTHGDFDHMGESINLVNNFKVNKVIFNCGPSNGLESKLMKTLDMKRIKHYSCIKELNIDRYKLQFLNTREYDNENDNSNVIYTELNNYKFLFMGDAGVEKEKDILDKYNLKDIDFLKIGHHGSNTSSSKEFIDSINPKYSLISVGKNNRYGHPKKLVLDILSNSKIYRTDFDGSIEIKLDENGYKIKTWAS